MGVFEDDNGMQVVVSLTRALLTGSGSGSRSDLLVEFGSDDQDRALVSVRPGVVRSGVGRLE